MDQKNLQNKCVQTFFKNSRLSCHIPSPLISSCSELNLSFLTRLMFIVEGNTHNQQLETEKNLAQESISTLIKKVPILITRKQPKNLSTTHWNKLVKFWNKFENLLLSDLTNGLKNTITKTPSPSQITLFKFLFINHRPIITVVLQTWI